MKVVNLVQQSKEWFDAKKRTIGASEISAILGHSEYNTPYDIWLKKTGRYEPSGKPNVAAERGNFFEGLIRAKYELETWMKLLPLSAVHDSNDRVSCSFDGIDTQAKVLIEIKVPKREVVDAARLGVLPSELQAIADEWRIKEFCKGGLVYPTYYPQVQYQLMIAGPEYVAHFLVGEFEKVNDRERIKAIHKVIVKPYPEFQARLMIAAIGFLDLIDKDIQPPLMDRDVMELTSESAKVLFKRLWKYKARTDKNKKSKLSKAMFEVVKAQVIELCEVEAKHVNCECEGLVIRKDKKGTWSVRKAS